MKNYFKTAVLAVLLALSCVTASAQQNLLGTTTLSAAIAGSLLGQGVSATTNPPPQLIQVASATGIVGLNPNLGITASQPNRTMLFIGREQMLVTAVNGTTLTVVRGVNGTVAAPHPSGDMVLFGPPRFFYVNDPGGTPTTTTGTSGVSCTAANVVVSPWLNTRTGGQWLCSSVTGTWVPGWNNAGGDFFQQTATVPAAAGVVLPSGPLFIISGAGAITGFTIPLGCNATAVGGCQFTVIAAAGSTWTWTAAGNIMTAGTGTAGHTFNFIWSQSLLKWVPSSLS